MTDKTEHSPIEPEGVGARHLTDDDVEGHKRVHRGAIEPAPGEPGGEDVEGHSVKSEDAPAPDGARQYK